VTTSTAPVSKPGQETCDNSGTSALGALDVATGHDWDGTFNTTYRSWEVKTIRGETHTAPSGATSGTYWAFWLNDKYATSGLCDAQLQTGDQVLLFPDCFGAGCTSPTPLKVSGVPATAAPGQSATVKVEEMVVDQSSWPYTTSAEPAAGATVTAGGRTATTGADGIAAVTFAGSGPQTVQATKPQHVRTAAEPVCVTTGSDGACGTTAPKPCATSGADGLCGTTDRTAPAVALSGLRHRYARRRAPRTLSGTVTPDPSGIGDVRLRLKRRDGRRCEGYDARRERFARVSCWHNGAWFSAGDRERWSYLLPARLGRGRYTLDVFALDRAGNAAPRVRAAFEVR
jgi:hypothetical protein